MAMQPIVFPTSLCAAAVDLNSDYTEAVAVWGHFFNYLSCFRESLIQDRIFLATLIHQDKHG
jgi:hypothetical protein